MNFVTASKVTVMVGGAGAKQIGRGHNDDAAGGAGKCGHIKLCRTLMAEWFAALRRYCNSQVREIAKGVVAWRWKFSAMGLFNVDRTLVFSVS